MHPGTFTLSYPELVWLLEVDPVEFLFPLPDKAKHFEGASLVVALCPSSILQTGFSGIAMLVSEIYTN